MRAQNQKGDGKNNAYGNLEKELRARGQSQAVPPQDLLVVVPETDGPKGDGHDNDQPEENVAKVSPQERGNNCPEQDQDAAHGGRARLRLVGFWPLLADVLSHLKF